MAMFGFLEAAALAAWAAFCFWQLGHIESDASKTRYKPGRMWWMLSYRMFTMSFVWVGILHTGAIFYFTQNCAADSWQFIMGFVSFVVHALVFKAWWYMYWHGTSKGRKQSSTGLLFLMFVTAVLFVVSIVTEQSSPLWYVALIWFGVYILWLLWTAVIISFSVTVKVSVNQGDVETAGGSDSESSEESYDKHGRVKHRKSIVYDRTTRETHQNQKVVQKNDLRREEDVEYTTAQTQISSLYHPLIDHKPGQ